MLIGILFSLLDSIGKGAAASAALPIAVRIAAAEETDIAARRRQQLGAELASRSRNDQWWFYSNLTFESAQQHLADGEPAAALRDLLVVCYFDLNGARNPGRDDAGCFDPDEGILSPELVDRVAALAADFNLDETHLKTLFIDAAREVRAVVRLPLSPARAWPLLAEDLPPACRNLRHPSADHP
jgi:hypothetical protein